MSDTQDDAHIAAAATPDATSEAGSTRTQSDEPCLDENFLRTLLEAQNKNMMALIDSLRLVSNRKIILPDFDPEKEDVDARAWCSTVDLCLSEQEQQGSALILALSGALKGNASQWLSQVSFAGMTWTHFKELFLARYGLIETPAATLIIMQNSKPKENENMASYAARLSTTLTARFKDMTTEQITLAMVLAHVSQFDGRLQRTAFTTEIKTREQMQRELQACCYSKRRNNEVPFDGSATKRPRPAPNGPMRCSFCGKLGHRTTDCRFKDSIRSCDFSYFPKAASLLQQRPNASGVSCFRCGQSGHFANECRHASNPVASKSAAGSGGANGSGGGSSAAAASDNIQRRVDLCSISNPTGKMNIAVPMTQVIAVAGEPVYLPCDIATQDEDDAVLLVLWYREDLGTPIYSVDARERDFGVAERWSDESVFASRAYFLPERRPAELGVDRVKATDQGIYRCRVDFKQAQTRNSRVNLTIIVPPGKMEITDDKGDVKQAIVGPYVEGDSFSLKCDVTGGRPRPWIKWFRDEVEQDTPVTPLPDNGVRGVIRVGPLTRTDVRSTFTCRSSNHQRAHPIETTLTLDMNFPPLTVHILGSNQPLSASRRYDLLCQSSGSRPPASITWWKNGHRINNAKETLSTDGNTTTSTVSLQLSKTDAGAKLACRASNPQMPSLPALEDDWTLDIQYVPETVVRLGTNLDPTNIREGSDVYFDCIINAHPYVYKVEWRHNGKTLLHNVGHGVIISNQSLVLQGVGRKTAGNYTCVGFNAEGDGESKPFSLDVLYAPTCRSSQQRVHGVAKQERAHITCHVDANPPEVIFRWTFNNTANSNEVSESYVSKAGTSSTVTYTPHTEMDYGTLLCWAHNRIGKQRVPCVYHIIAAGRPDQVHNCTVVNASLTSFGVRCSEGFNGGMPQSFLLEVREIVTQEIVANVSSPIPRFMAVGLAPGRTYAAAVLAYNAKGRGDPYPLRASTLRPPEKHHVHDKSLDLPRTAFQMSGAMSAAVGGGGVLMVVLVLFMIAMRQRCAKRKPRSAPPPSSQPASPDKLREKDDSESDDRNPDIIPSDTDQMQMDYYRQQQVSTISPPPGSRGPRGSVAGVRGGLPGYCPLRTAPPMHEAANSSSGIPPPARFAAGSCTLPRGSTMAAPPADSRCGIPLQHLRTLPRPLPAPTPAPRITPRDTPL